MLLNGMAMAFKGIENTARPVEAERGPRTRWVMVMVVFRTRADGLHQEVYLLQTRLQKMPYKHIAAHLKKTELACRLHYHQLSHGTNRRKRSASFSSRSSSHPPQSPEQSLSPELDSSTAPTSPEQMPVERADGFATWGVRPRLPEPASATSIVSHKPILPKPVTSLPYPLQTHNVNLRLERGSAFGRSQPVINTDRLREIYEAHKANFWRMIASDYGEGADPEMLEQLWRRGPVQGPPTPDEMSEHRTLGSLPEGRVVLPALQPSRHERSYSPPQSRYAPSSTGSPVFPQSNILPTPSTASSELPGLSATSVPATAISALLNDTAHQRRLPRIETSTGYIRGDTLMRDPGR